MPPPMHQAALGHHRSAALGPEETDKGDPAGACWAGGVRLLRLTLQQDTVEVEGGRYRVGVGVRDSVWHLQMGRVALGACKTKMKPHHSTHREPGLGRKGLRVASQGGSPLDTILRREPSKAPSTLSGSPD